MNMYKETVNKQGKLPAFTFPGSYPIFYIDNYSNVVCNECASKTPDEIKHHDIHWEGESLFCEECNREIESAYGVDGD